MAAYLDADNPEIVDHQNCLGAAYLYRSEIPASNEAKAERDKAVLVLQNTLKRIPNHSEARRILAEANAD